MANVLCDLEKKECSSVVGWWSINVNYIKLADGIASVFSNFNDFLSASINYLEIVLTCQIIMCICLFFLMVLLVFVLYTLRFVIRCKNN